MPGLIAMSTECLPEPNYPYTVYPLLCRADVLLMVVTLFMVDQTIGAQVSSIEFILWTNYCISHGYRCHKG